MIILNNKQYSINQMRFSAFLFFMGLVILGYSQEVCGTINNGAITANFGETTGENQTVIPILFELTTGCFFGEPGCISSDNRHNNACDTVCNGQASVWAHDGVPPYTYLWNTGATDSIISGICAGTYSCTVTDSVGNTDSLNIKIRDTNYVNTGLITGPLAVYQGDTATYAVNDNQGSYYYWYITGGTFITGPNGAQVTVVWNAVGLGNIGTHETDSANCVGDSVSHDVVVSLVANLKDEQEVKQAMVIYPNPFTDRTEIVFENSDGMAFEMRVLDLSGKLVRFKKDIKTEHVTFSRDGILTGIYFVELRSTDKIFLGKLIIE